MLFFLTTFVPIMGTDAFLISQDIEFLSQKRNIFYHAELTDKQIWILWRTNYRLNDCIKSGKLRSVSQTPQSFFWWMSLPSPESPKTPRVAQNRIFFFKFGISFYSMAMFLARAFCVFAHLWAKCNHKWLQKTAFTLVSVVFSLFSKMKGVLFYGQWQQKNRRR